VQKVVSRKEVMSLASTIQQPEIMHPGADPHEYPQRFRLEIRLTLESYDRLEARDVR